MSSQGSVRPFPVVLGGRPVWAPAGRVVWSDGEPSWDRVLNAFDPNAVCWPQFGAEEVLAVAEAVASGQWAYEGPVQAAVEARLAVAAGAGHAFFVANGSFALSAVFHALLASEGWKWNGQAPEAITSFSTFQATATMLGRSGVVPVLADVDPDTLTIGVREIAPLVTERTRFVVVVPIYAFCPDLEEIRAFCDQRGLFLVVDGAHAPFGTWKGRSYACWAHAVTSSFQSSKVLTCGEGGVIYTEDDVLAALICEARNCGRRGSGYWWPSSVNAFDLIGDNIRISELHAALLGAQLDRYPAQQAQREKQWELFINQWVKLTGLHSSFEVLKPSAQAGNLFYKVAIRNRTEIPTDALREALSRELTCEIASPYAPLGMRASGYVPETAPWQFPHLIGRSQGWAPNATYAYEGLMMLAHEFFLRRDAATQLIAALEKIEAYTRALTTWAQTR